MDIRVTSYRVLALVLLSVIAGGSFAMGGKGPASEAARLETAPTPVAGASEKEAVPGEVVVVFKDGTSDAVVAEALSKVPATLKERSAVNPLRMVVTVAVGAEEAAVRSLRDMECVRAAEVNYILKAQTDETPDERTGAAEKKDFNDESMKTGFEAGPAIK